MKKSKKALAILLILGVQLFNLGGLYYPFVVHAQTPIEFNVDLKFGATNSQEVRDLQLFLTQLGYYNGPITGNFFSLTQDGVLAFQRANGISPTGFVGPETRAVLNSPSALPSDITPDFLAWIQKFYPEVNSETRYNRALRERYTLETGRGAGMGDSRNSGVPVYGPLPGETPFVQTLTLPVLLPPGVAESSIGGSVTANFQSWLQQHYSSLSPYNPRVRELYTLLTGRGATVGDSRNTGNPVYGPLPGETPFIQTYTRPSLSSLPIEDIRGTNITDPIVTPPIDVSIFDPRYLDWLDRNSPGANPHDLIIRQRYTNETGLGALRTDARNFLLPRFQQNLPYGNDFIFPGGTPLNFPQPGFKEVIPDGRVGVGVDPTLIPVPSPSPIGPFGLPPTDAGAEGSAPTGGAPTGGDASTGNTSMTAADAQMAVSVVGGVFGIPVSITIGAVKAYNDDPNIGVFGAIAQGVKTAYENSVLGKVVNAVLGVEPTPPQTPEKTALDKTIAIDKEVTKAFRALFDPQPLEELDLELEPLQQSLQQDREPMFKNIPETFPGYVPQQQNETNFGRRGNEPDPEDEDIGGDSTGGPTGGTGSADGTASGGDTGAGAATGGAATGGEP